MFWWGRDYSDHGSRVLDSNNARRPSVGRMPRAPPPPARPRTRLLLFAKYKCPCHDVRYEMRCPTFNNHMCVLLMNVLAGVPGHFGTVELSGS